MDLGGWVWGYGLDLAEGRDRWRAVVTTVMKLQANVDVSYTPCTPLALSYLSVLQGADKSLARPRRKEANVSIRMA